MTSCSARVCAVSLFCAATCFASTASVNTSVKSIFSTEVETSSMLYFISFAERSASIADASSLRIPTSSSAV